MEGEQGTESSRKANSSGVSAGDVEAFDHDVGMLAADELIVSGLTLEGESLQHVASLPRHQVVVVEVEEVVAPVESPRQ